MKFFFFSFYFLIETTFYLENEIKLLNPLEAVNIQREIVYILRNFG